MRNKQTNKKRQSQKVWCWVPAFSLCDPRPVIQPLWASPLSSVGQEWWCLILDFSSQWNTACRYFVNCKAPWKCDVLLLVGSCITLRLFCGIFGTRECQLKKCRIHLFFFVLYCFTLLLPTSQCDLKASLKIKAASRLSFQKKYGFFFFFVALHLEQ